MRRDRGSVHPMDRTTAILAELPSGFHWEVAGLGASRRCIAVPDAAPEVWLATIGQNGATCTATIRRHKARTMQIDRPFRTSAAAAGWVARWLDRQGHLIQAELGDRFSQRLGLPAISLD